MLPPLSPARQAGDSASLSSVTLVRWAGVAPASPASRAGAPLTEPHTWFETKWSERRDSHPRGYQLHRRTPYICSRTGVAPVSDIVWDGFAKPILMGVNSHLLVSQWDEDGDRRDACPTPSATPSAWFATASLRLSRETGVAPVADRIRVWLEFSSVRQ